MTRKRQRLYMLVAALVALGAAAALVLSAFEDNLVFFHAPSDLAGRDMAPGQRLRLGGLVAAGSVRREGATVHFVVTDLAATVPVSYTGILPDLFREGQGVVAEGTLGPDGRFLAAEVLAKHDETYMPREVADALKAAGQWRAGGAAE